MGEIHTCVQLDFHLRYSEISSGRSGVQKPEDVKLLCSGFLGF